MSGGAICRCNARTWLVIKYLCNHSAFNGYRRTSSDYSTVMCTSCGAKWRTKAAYVHGLPIAARATE